MEKKGEILNQLAIISDLIEKINANILTNTIMFEVSREEFEKIFKHINNKNNRKLETPEEKFTITIGVVDIIFSTNNV